MLWFIQSDLAENRFYVAHATAGRLPIQFASEEQARAVCAAINAPIVAQMNAKP